MKLFEPKYCIIGFVIGVLLSLFDACHALSDTSYHLIADFSQCDPLLLDDGDYIIEAMDEAAVASGFTVLEGIHHQFDPQGFTGILLLSESHFSIHTWPEDNFAAVDLFTCGDTSPEAAVKALQDKLGCKKVDK